MLSARDGKTDNVEHNVQHKRAIEVDPAVIARVCVDVVQVPHLEVCGGVSGRPSISIISRCT